MRIGVVLTASYETSLGVVVRVRELVSALSQIGHEVHVLTPFPQHGLVKLTNVNIHRIGSRLKYNKLSLRLLARIQSYKPFWRRYLLRGGLEKVAYSVAKELVELVQGLDLDILQGEQEVAALACAFLGEELSIPTVASLHNIAPEELVARHIITRDDLQYQSFIDLIRKITASTNKTIVLSEEMKRFLISNYSVDGESILVVPLAAKPRTTEVAFDERPNRIVYAGLVSKLDDPLLFVKSIPFVTSRHRESRFFMTKLGEELQAIKRFVKREQIQLSLFWFNDISSFFDFLLTCHVGVVTSADDITRKFGWAMKFFDYLSAGLPVVANDIGGWTRVIREERVGLLCQSSPESLAETILYLLNNPEVRYEMAKRALHLADTRFSIAAIAKRLSDDLHVLKKAG